MKSDDPSGTSAYSQGQKGHMVALASSAVTYYPLKKWHIPPLEEI